jgi:lipopolysaccharide transport system permease protein
LGFLWAFVNPIVMLLIYTFIFSVVFESKWGGATVATQTNFSLILFVGLIIHGFFSECLNAAPGLIVANRNYVKRVVFPIEIFPVITAGAIFFHTVINIIILVIVQFFLMGTLSVSIVLLPLVLLPLMLGTLGLMWIVSAAGVFIRDIGQTIALLTTGMLFISAVFFPLDALPESFRKYLVFNPLAILIQDCRKVLLFGEWPDVYSLFLLFLLSVIVAWSGFCLFQKARKGFSDVL